MLISEYERNRLDQAGILKGVLACIYRVNLSWPLIQAFISFWDSDGHTLVTAQGEMGYPLMVIQEAMGIPISGRVYDEYAPEDNVNDKVARELFKAYAELSWRNNGKNPNSVRRPVLITDWVDYFLEDSEHLEGQQHIPLPSSYYASHEDPLLKALNFRVGGNGEGCPFVFIFRIN